MSSRPRYDVFGNRLTPRQSNDTGYFEALAADIVRDRRKTVGLGAGQFDVELKSWDFGRRVVLIARHDGRVIHQINASRYQDYVGLVADYLIFLNAGLPGIVVPGSGAG